MQFGRKVFGNMQNIRHLPEVLRFKLYRKSLLHSQFYRTWQNELLDMNEINYKKITHLKETYMLLNETFKDDHYDVCRMRIHRHFPAVN